MNLFFVSSAVNFTNLMDICISSINIFWMKLMVGEFGYSRQGN